MFLPGARSDDRDAHRKGPSPGPAEAAGSQPGPRDPGAVIGVPSSGRTAGYVAPAYTGSRNPAGGDSPGSAAPSAHAPTRATPTPRTSPCGEDRGQRCRMTCHNGDGIWRGETGAMGAPGSRSDPGGRSSTRPERRRPVPIGTTMAHGSRQGHAAREPRRINGEAGPPHAPTAPHRGRPPRRPTR